MCNQCRKCEHYDTCGAGTKNCQSFVPKSESDAAEMSRNAFRRELKEFRQAWHDYERYAQDGER